MTQPDLHFLVQVTERLWIRPEEILYIRPAHKNDGCSHLIVTLDNDNIPINAHIHPSGIAGILSLVLKLNHIKLQDTYIVYDKIVSIEFHANEDNSYGLCIRMKNNQMHLTRFENWEAVPGFLKLKPEYLLGCTC
jgi:hypothetical protein